jgi:ABC-2 type transport system ATP-binding protein
MLLGLLYPTTGVARVFGRPPTDTAIKARIGFMPEESYLYRYLNAYETLDYYGRLFRLDRAERTRRTEQLVEMVGLTRAGRRPVGTYSKGMARRIGLAQALVNDPDLLILDEPTTGLDPVGTRQIKDVIRILGERGKTVLLCSHLLADVEDVCDRVAIMYGGRRQALGAVQTLLQRSDVTQISARQLQPATIEKIRKLISDAGSETLSVDHPTDRLEDLFLRVVGRAQRDKLQTSGAESTSGVSEFLGGTGMTPRDIVESLVRAGRESDEADRPAADEHAEDRAAAAAVRDDVVERLVDATKPAPPPPSEPIESPLPSRKPNQAVIDRLVHSGDQPREKPADSSDPSKS